jgi:hypothetical protein
MYYGITGVVYNKLYNMAIMDHKKLRCEILRDYITHMVINAKQYIIGY